MKRNREEIIVRLEEAIKTKDYELIGDSIRESGIINMLNHIVEKDCSMPLFRVRCQSTSEDFPFSNIDNFSYAPNPSEGRCNLKGDSLLYTALESRTAVQEMIRQEHVGNNIWLSLWLPMKALKCLVFLFDSSEIEDEYTKKIHQDIIDNFKDDDTSFEENLPLYQWISKQFMSDDYAFSSQLCNELFKTHDIDGILYPSYAGKSHGLNIAIRKEFADSYLGFQDILSLKIHTWTFPNEVQYMILGKSFIYENGDIQWSLNENQDTAPFITERRLREKASTKGSILFQHNFGIESKE